MKKYFALLLAIVSLVACTPRQKVEEAPSAPRVLVLYYSQTGATQRVAKEIHQQLQDADIEAIQVAVPYDGDFNQTIQRCQAEMQADSLPGLLPLQSNLESYDVIFLGYPIWFGNYALPIASLVRDNAFEGKTIVPFCTFGSGGLEASVISLSKALPKANISTGYGIRNARLDEVSSEVNRFLIEQGHKPGEVEPLPAFMEHHPVTPEERDVFQQACGDYQFPLGTPEDVAVRETEASTDYEFTASNMDDEGNVTHSLIYVTVSHTQGARPIFTQVVRY